MPVATKHKKRIKVQGSLKTLRQKTLYLPPHTHTHPHPHTHTHTWEKHCPQWFKFWKKRKEEEEEEEK